MVMYVQASSDPTEQKKFVLSTLFDNELAGSKKNVMAQKSLIRISSEKSNFNAQFDSLDNASYPESPSSPLIPSIETFSASNLLSPPKLNLLDSNDNAEIIPAFSPISEKYKNHSSFETTDQNTDSNHSATKAYLNPTVENKPPPKEVRRSSKPNTIHSEAQKGDLRALRILLQENPSAINMRNPIMSQTPLHVAVTSNQIDAVKFLLDWHGPELINIEAKNMYGETPLHLAAKNGYCQIVRSLLQKGAKTNVQATNGMTPLHLAVWCCMKGEDNGVVEMLLEYDADVSAQDKEKKTAIDHLPKACTNHQLVNILHSHLRKQIAAKAQEALKGSKQKMELLERELSSLVGLDELKAQVRKWGKGMLLDEKRRTLGIHILPRQAPHMAFLGNPGTGKTTVARVMAKLLHMVGVIPTCKVVEVQRTDLVGEFVGHTGPKTRKKIDEAMGGVLFVDEAYRLMPVQKEDEKDYGAEALEEIMAVMDAGKIVVIFAGYKVPMQRVFEVNEGFRRRINKFFTFNDLNSTQIAQVLLLKMESQDDKSPLYGFRLSENCTCEAISQLLLENTCEEVRNKHNGGLAQSILLDARDHLDSRLDLECCDPDELITIDLQDLEAAMKLL